MRVNLCARMKRRLLSTLAVLVCTAATPINSFAQG
jgi:hypothetical protein